MSGIFPSFAKAKGLELEQQEVFPNSAEGAANTVTPGVRVVKVGANVNGTSDFFVLPSLALVPNGHVITVIAGAANSNVRTPASSNEKINAQDSDGTKQYLLTATQIHTFTKIDNTIGWMGEGRTAIGAYATAIVPA